MAELKKYKRYKNIKFINGGDLHISNETNKHIKFFTGSNNATQQAEWSIEHDGKIWYRTRTRTNANANWGSWSSWKQSMSDQVVEYRYTDFTFNPGFETYNTTSGHAYEVKAIKYGRMVQIQGIIKVTADQTATSVTVAKVPSGCEPLAQLNLLELADGAKKCRVNITTDGKINVSAYGTTSAGAMSTGSWFSIDATYISKV